MLVFLTLAYQQLRPRAEKPDVRSSVHTCSFPSWTASSSARKAWRHRRRVSWTSERSSFFQLSRKAPLEARAEPSRKLGCESEWGLRACSHYKLIAELFSAPKKRSITLSHIYAWVPLGRSDASRASSRAERRQLAENLKKCDGASLGQFLSQRAPHTLSLRTSWFTVS